MFNSEIKVNWAFQGQQHKEDTTNHYHIFVGDLSPEVNDETLGKAFSAFGSMSDARVMWDVNSGKSRGYGFVAFRDKTDAEQAIATMNGEWLGSRAIRCNWANQKVQSATQGSQQMTMSYEAVVAQTPAYNSTVYVGNLTPNTTQQDLIPIFQQFGYIHEVRLQADRGFAFVKLDTHENAAMSIVQLQGYNINGRPAKLSWGKDRDPGQQQNHWTQQSFYPQQGYYQQSHQQPYYQQPAHHTYGPAPTSEYDLPPGMSAPPTLASLDSQQGAGAATPGPGSQGWDQYYSYYYQGSPSHYHQGATGTPGSHHAQTPNGY
jgi:nucleolysin TIA-1/TIAR